MGFGRREKAGGDPVVGAGPPALPRRGGAAAGQPGVGDRPSTEISGVPSVFAPPISAPAPGDYPRTAEGVRAGALIFASASRRATITGTGDSRRILLAQLPNSIRFMAP